MTRDDDFSLHSRGDFFPPPSRPRKVVGGIKAQTRSGDFGATWWSRRWITALEAMGVGGRLTRGRTYARAGQVVTLEPELGAIVATVQGTRTRPYEVRIDVAQLPQRTWALAARALGGQAIYAAQLLAGSMPDDIEATLAGHGIALFPGAGDGLQTQCTCPDWQPFCKHAAAASYLVGELLDRDPFVIFQLRGIEREVLLAMLAGEAARGADSTPTPTPAAVSAADTSAAVATEQPVATADALTFEDAAAFWGTAWDARPRPGIPGGLEPPPFDAPLVRRLGPPAMWRGSEPLVDVLERTYRTAAAGPALPTALGD